MGKHECGRVHAVRRNDDRDDSVNKRARTKGVAPAFSAYWYRPKATWNNAVHRWDADAIYFVGVCVVFCPMAPRRWRFVASCIPWSMSKVLFGQNEVYLWDIRNFWRMFLLCGVSESALYNSSIVCFFKNVLWRILVSNWDPWIQNGERNITDVSNYAVCIFHQWVWIENLIYRYVK